MAQGIVENLEVKLDALERGSRPEEDRQGERRFRSLQRRTFTMSSRQAGRARWSAMECWLARH